MNGKGSSSRSSRLHRSTKSDLQAQQGGGGTTTNTSDDLTDPRLKNLEPKIVEMIMNEIMDKSPKVEWSLSFIITINIRAMCLRFLLYVMILTFILFFSHFW